MKFLWLACAGGGAVPPQLALCEALVDRGHEVIAVVGTNKQERAARIGMQVDAFEVEPVPPGLSDSEIDQWIIEEAFLGAMYARVLRVAIDEHKPDRLLVDGMSYSGLVEAQASGLPHAALWHCLVDIAETRFTLESLDAGTNIATHNDHRRNRGLDAVESVQDNLDAADWFLAFVYEALDTPRRHEWKNLHYVGAAVPRMPRSNVNLPLGTEPLVVVGFSTTMVEQTSVLQRVFDALATLDVRVMATVDRETIDKLTLSDNVVAAEWVPHDEVLPEAALMISHVGHGTMSAAARHGVPILALPGGIDQDRNAEVIASLGIGSWLPPESSSAEIAKAAVTILADAAIQHRSDEVARAISSQAGGLELAVDLVTSP